MSDETRSSREGFYWVVLGQNPPKILGTRRVVARWWQPDAVSVVSALGCGVNRPLSAEPREGGPGAA
jgi:hypothetical protein